MLERSCELNELKQLYEAVVAVGLPKPLQNPVKARGRKAFNRFLLLSIIVYGIQRGWSYRDMERFAKEHLDELKELDPGLRKAPDHSSFYVVASKLKVTDILRIYAKLKEQRGEVPVLWY
ncbi:hypothetical protein [Archaeoglobus veneficus]|uniref:Transposase n=2 Tax=root TaxID=1 RepID=F2KMG2_ARCVS|nr:hypothetical protein [Archaeoglobus veneficus]AEA46061.1 hypothetical protein Arcve_0017 [Archaeoglobus veneficus SNP6]